MLTIVSFSMHVVYSGAVRHCSTSPGGGVMGCSVMPHHLLRAGVSGAVMRAGLNADHGEYGSSDQTADGIVDVVDHR